MEDGLQLATRLVARFPHNLEKHGKWVWAFIFREMLGNLKKKFHNQGIVGEFLIVFLTERDNLYIFVFADWLLWLFSG